MHSIRVMTFNIRGSFHHWDDENRWEYRAALNVATIRQHAPDLIGFQECQSGNMDAYRAQLPEYQYVMGPKTGEEDFWDYNPIFWKAERFALIDSGGFWLSRTPDHWSKDWGSDEARGVTWVKLRCTRKLPLPMPATISFWTTASQIPTSQRARKTQSHPIPITGLKGSSTPRFMPTWHGVSTGF